MTEEHPVPEEALCLGCGYPLRGLVTFRCPECGRDFNPAVLETMNVGRPVPAALRGLLEPTRWLKKASVTACTVATVATLWTPQNAVIGPLLVLVAWAAVGLPFIVRRLARRGVVRTYRQSRSFLRVDDSVLWPMRGLFAAALLVTALRLPFRAAYFVSQGSLDRLARHVYQDIPWDETPFTPRICGACIIISLDAPGRYITFNLPLGGSITYVFSDNAAEPEFTVHVKRRVG